MLRRTTWRMQRRLSTSRPCSGEEGQQSYPIIFSLILFPSILFPPILFHPISPLRAASAGSEPKSP